MPNSFQSTTAKSVRFSRQASRSVRLKSRQAGKPPSLPRPVRSPMVWRLEPAHPDDDGDVRDVRVLTLEAVEAAFDEDVRPAPTNFGAATSVETPSAVPRVIRRRSDPRGE